MNNPYVSWIFYDMNSKNQLKKLSLLFWNWVRKLAQGIFNELGSLPALGYWFKHESG